MGARAHHRVPVLRPLRGREAEAELRYRGDGLLVVREPQGSRHAVVVDLVIAALQRAFGPGYYVRGDKPMALDELSEPEPDVIVLPGRPQDYLAAHPARPVLVVKVSDTSLVQDRLRKGGLYARSGIADYWLVNLVDNALEVYRQPVRARPVAPGGSTAACDC